MKTKEKKELKTKTVKELSLLLGQLREEVFKMRQDLSLKKLKNTSLIFHKRKDIARILTVLKEKEVVNESS